MTPDVRTKLTSLFGSVEDAPRNLVRVLDRKPELLDGIPGKAPYRWRQMSEPALEHALAINYLLLGPDGAFTQLVLDAAGEPARSNPAPHKTIIGDLFAGMGRVLKGTAKTISKTVTAGQSLARSLVASRKLKAKKPEGSQASLPSRMEKGILDLVSKPSEKSKLPTKRNPVDQALQVICQYQDGNQDIDLHEAPKDIVSIGDGDHVGEVGRLQWIMVLARAAKGSDYSWYLKYHGFTPLWRDNPQMKDAFNRVLQAVMDSPRKLEIAQQGPPLWVLPDCSSFYFQAQITDRGIVDKPDGRWPKGHEERRDHLAGIIDTFNANDPAWIGRDLVINRADDDDMILSPGRLVNVCYFSDRDREKKGAPYVHGFNSVFEDNAIIHETANEVIERASAADYAKCFTGPRLCVHEDGRLFLFNARITRDGIHEDGRP